MIPFDKSSNIFDTEPFISEEVIFNLIHRIRDGKDPILMKSEDGKIIIAQSSEQYPAWIWIDKDIKEENYEEIAYDFYKLFSNRSTLKFVAKPQIAEFLANYYAEREKVTFRISMSMEAYHCPKIIFPTNVTGAISKPSLEDVNIITEFFVGFIKDCFGTSTSIDKQIKNAKSYILSDNFYIWKNGDEIVSIANIAHRSSRHGRINEVYTPPLQRKKGYAGALVSELSKILQSENRTPMLYTDLSNHASNKSYKNVGFIECGKVDQISFEIKENY